MDETKTQIAIVVSEKSVDYYDRLIETIRLLGYETIKNAILSDNPLHEGLIVDPMGVLRSAVEKMETIKLKDVMVKEGKNYVKLSEFLEVKSDKLC